MKKQRTHLPLRPGERILWQGRSQKPLLTPRFVLSELLGAAAWGIFCASLYGPTQESVLAYSPFRAPEADSILQGLLLLLGLVCILRPILQRHILLNTLYISTPARLIAYNTLTNTTELSVSAPQVWEMDFTWHKGELVSLSKSVYEPSSGNSLAIRKGFEYLPAAVLTPYRDA